MSDDTKALIDRLRDHENEGVTGSDRFHLRNEAAATIERQAHELADRDALAERCEKLREALQELVCCDEIVKHGQHERGEKVKGGRWARAWDRARAALKDAP